jgi:hypothetical protein
MELLFSHNSVMTTSKDDVIIVVVDDDVLVIVTADILNHFIVSSILNFATYSIFSLTYSNKRKRAICPP